MDARGRAIETLYRERYVAFRNALATVTGSYDSAHDAVQEAFATALRERESLRDDASLAAWVWRIALHAASKQRTRSAAAANGSPVADLVRPERDPELADAVRQLPPRRRLVVFLRYFADLSYAEIAEICEISEGTVAATLAQAHDALEQALSERGGTR